MINNKYYLGLDLGISSAGWAVMAQKGKDFYIDDFGVRLFDSSENPQEGTTNAEKRRKFRSSRRLIRRRKQLISNLKSFLAKHNIVEISQINSFFQNYKITNNIKYNDKKYFNPYVIRTKGLTVKLTPQELAAALINIANHCGYNDKFLFSKDEKDKKSKLDNSIAQASKVVSQYSTIAQAITSDKDLKNELNNNTLG